MNRLSSCCNTTWSLTERRNNFLWMIQTLLNHRTKLMDMLSRNIYARCISKYIDIFQKLILKPNISTGTLKCFWGILPTFPLHDQSAALVFYSDAKNVTLWVLLYSATGSTCDIPSGYRCTQGTFTTQHFYPAWFQQLHTDIPPKHFFHLLAPEPCWYCGRRIS